MPSLDTIVLAASLAAVTPYQLLPPPADGDIRAVYWELRNESEVWLTLEPKTAKGERAPLLTLTIRFRGKYPSATPSEVEARAYAGALWAPRAEFWLLLDGRHKVDLAARARTGGLISGTPSDYLSEPMSIDTLRLVAGAQRVSGNALGFDFELNGAQRDAIVRFLQLTLSGNPARQPRR